MPVISICRLSIASNLHLSPVVIKIDSNVIITLICHANGTFHPLGTLTSDIRELLVQIPHIGVQHTFRKDCMAADLLGNLVLNIQNEFVHFISPLSSLSPILLGNIINTFYININYLCTPNFLVIFFLAKKNTGDILLIIR